MIRFLAYHEFSLFFLLSFFLFFLLSINAVQTLHGVY